MQFNPIIFILRVIKTCPVNMTVIDIGYAVLLNYGKYLITYNIIVNRGIM